jgi:hypothetical protein
VWLIALFRSGRSFEGARAGSVARPGISIEGFMKHQFDLTKLPPGPAAKLRLLRQKSGDALGLAKVAEDRQHGARRALAEGEQRLAAYSQPHGRMDYIDDGSRLMMPVARGVLKVAADDPRVIATQRDIERSKAEASHYGELAEARHAAWTNIAQLVTALEKYLSSCAHGIAAFEGEVEPKLKRNDSLTEAIEQRRRRLRELRADLRRIAAAPYPSVTAKEVLRAHVTALAERGAPDLLPLIEEGRPEIGGPVNHRFEEVHGTAQGSLPVRGSVRFPVPDLLSLLAWLDPDRLIARLEAAIDELADDDNALTDDQRTEARTQVTNDMLAVEREEEALVCRAEAENLTVQRRPDCDPRAVLGLSSSMPPYRSKIQCPTLSNSACEHLRTERLSQMQNPSLASPVTRPITPASS